MQIVEVVSPNHIKKFLDVVDYIYRDDINYVRPLDVMIEEIFSLKTNDLFKNGDAIRFLLFDDNKVVGRIAAFVNRKKAFLNSPSVGGVGFFECVNNQEAANELFNSAKQWLTIQGVEAMDGPINFGENDNFWGLLVDGFTQPGFGMQYNPPYYRQLFENYGFKIYYEQITNHLNLKKPFPDRFWKIAERVMQKPGLSFKHFKWSDIDKFAADFVEIYNEAWQFHEGFSSMEPSHIANIINKAKPFVMEDLIWFAYYNGEPVGFIVMFLDANQVIKMFNGKLNFINKLRLLYYKRRKLMTRIRVTVLGVKPKFQKMGIESCLFYQYRDVVAQNPHIVEMELSWVGDFNPKMRKLEDAMGSEFGKKHITYRYLFNDSRDDFKQFSVIPMNTKEMIVNK
ncbi:MAG: GNAT family N-acetyltransferase [Marinilabiliaceae bacterium]|nr:GNAT family N-acetyltransferase [Marinilabiliaceae bacterium]